MNKVLSPVPISLVMVLLVLSSCCCFSVISGFIVLPSTCRHRNGLVYSSSLFGIKGFRAWFETRFPDSIVNIDVPDANEKNRGNTKNQKSAKQAASSSSQEYFDHVLIDMNQILHVVLRRSRNEEHATRLLMVEMDRLLRMVTPTKSLVLAIDGPPAAAKLATQRRRRYGTLVRTKWKLSHFDKLRIPKRQRAKRLRGYKSELQSLKLTPATSFMKQMEDTLLYWAWQRLQQRNSKFRKVKIYINPSTVPGEGEVKLLEWIFRHPLREQSIAIFGRDSDLLLEGLVIPPSWAHNVFIIREEGPVDYLCVSLWETTRTLWNEWLLPQSSSSPSSPNFANQILQIRTDLVLLMILNGNDYLPKLRGARGFSHICNTYMGLLRSTNTTNAPAGMVHPDKLEFHLDFCISFFQEIVKSQPPELWNTSEVQTNNTDINKKTPLGELNNIMDGGFVPRPLRFRVLKKRTGAIDEDEEEYDGLQGVEGSEHFEDEEEEKEESHRDDDEADEEDDEADDDDDDQEDRDKVLVQLTLGVAGTDYCSQYELWHGKGEPFKAAKQKLAAMALDDFLGTDYSNADGFDVESGITTSGYSWEIAQAVEGKVDRFLGGLLWNLQTYQDGLCADYHYNYGKRMSPTPTEIMEFFQQAKAENRTVGRRELLATSFGKPVSAGLSCLAALPSQVKHLVPEPYSWLPDDRVEQFYEQCMDPTDNFFDLKQFEQLCEDEIDKIQKQRYDGNEVSTVAEKKNNFEEDGHGRRIIMGDHYWTVIGRTTEPLTHPFEPPKPPGDRLSTLWPNNRIRTSRMLVLGSPRPRSVWGDKPLAPDERKRIQHSKHVGCEIIHSDLGNFLKGKKSLLDVEYKVGYRNKIAAMTNKNKGKMEFQSLKVELKIPPVDQDTIDQETVDISSRMQEFNKTMPLMEPLVNLDSQTAMACSQQLCDIGIIGAIKFEMTTPSKSDYASHDPITYEHLHLTVRKATESGILQADLVYDQDRDVHKQSRQAMKQHLVSRALDDIVGPSYRWHELSFVDLSRLLMERVPVTGKEERRTKAAAAPKKKKIDVKRRLKQFNKVEPPTSPVLNLDNQTALTCLKQLGDIGMIGQMKFTTTAPSRSEYASYNPSNYEHYHLLIPQGPGDNSNEILYKDLEYDQDRDIKTGNRQVMRQHLASLALCDITGSQRRWSEMSFEDLRDFLMEKAKNTSLKQPLN